MAINMLIKKKNTHTHNKIFPWDDKVPWEIKKFPMGR